MFFTARVDHGSEANARGAIGLARSDDLFHWALQAPIYAGGDYEQLEVPQVFEIGGRWYCLFGMAAEHWSQARARAHVEAGHGPPVWGSHYLVAPKVTGPWTVAEGPCLDRALTCRRYAAKIVDGGAGRVLLGFRYWGADGRFVGEIGDPVAVRVDASSGRLSLTA